jgi:hypothetical protein
MIDFRRAILKALYTRLTAQTVPVYSLVPDDAAMPFIYIGDMDFGITENKNRFDVVGTINVELFYSLIDSVGSLEPMLDTLQQIRYLLSPTPQIVLDLSASGLGMTYWKLFNDTGPFQFSENSRELTAVLQYEYRVQQVASSPNNIFNVIHLLDDVVHKQDKVFHIN